MAVTRKESTMKDGWHVVYGRDVYVEDGRVRRGLSHDGQRTVYPYRATKGGWVREYSPTVCAFRAGLRRSTMALL